MTLIMTTQPMGRQRLKKTIHSIAQYRGAVELGWYDFIARFRRSWIGPLWSPIQMGIFVAVLVVIFERGLVGDSTNYVLYLALGFYAWDFVSAALSEGAVHFTSQASLMKNTPVDISYITVRKISFLFCRSALNAPIPIAAVIFFGGEFNMNTWLVLLTPFLFAGFTYGCLVIFGIIGAFFFDFAHLMQTVMRFLFFTTPVIWAGDAGLRKAIADYNPLSYFLEIVRAPFRGEIASPTTWAVVSAASIFAFVIALWMQSAFRTRLIYRL